MINRQAGVLGLICAFIGLIWRLEVECHGWTGLIWIEYFHWAVPVGAVVFLSWFAHQSREMKSHPVLLLVVAMIGVLAYFAGTISMSLAWSRLLGLMVAPWVAYVLHFFPYLIYAFVGASYFLALGSIGGIRFLKLLPGIILYIAAFPLSMLLLSVTHHKGGSDVFHAIKSGLVFSVIAFAIGLPLVLKRDEKVEKSSCKGCVSFRWNKDRWRLFALLSLVPCLLLMLPFGLVLPYDGDHPYTPLIWPGLVIYTGLFIAVISQRVADWPSKGFALWFNIMISGLAALMAAVAILFALAPT